MIKKIRAGTVLKYLWVMKQPVPTTLNYRDPLWIQILWEMQPLVHESYSCNDLDKQKPLCEISLEVNRKSVQDQRQTC